MKDNSEQVEYWNGSAGETWVRIQDRIDQLLAPMTEVALGKTGLSTGDRAIDIGCGCGTTSLLLAAQGASVWGVDISAPMLRHARERASGQDKIHFSEGDASVQAYTPDHQLVFSRFGVMFFADPVAAFSNIHSALTEDGRLLFLCWQSPANNPWLSVPGAALQEFRKDEPPEDPQAAGPFAFGDVDYTTGILTSAGFNDIQIEEVNKDLTLGDTLDEAVEFQSKIGPLSGVLGQLNKADQLRATSAVKDALAAYVSERGVVMRGAALLVSARA